MKKQSHNLDWAFFIRPFNNTSWFSSLGKTLRIKKFEIFGVNKKSTFWPSSK
jgi:hypothetical protein